MEFDRVASYVGAAASFALALVLSIPYLLVEGHAELLVAYYGAGPLGAFGAVFLSVLAVVIFLSGERGRADPIVVAGIAVVVGVVLLGVVALWSASITDSLLFSFPPEYSWLEYHAPASVVIAAVVAVAGVVYAWAVQ
ncbi:MAG: DUF7548 family protein [Halobacteriota archaeon]